MYMWVYHCQQHMMYTARRHQMQNDIYIWNIMLLFVTTFVSVLPKFIFTQIISIRKQSVLEMVFVSDLSGRMYYSTKPIHIFYSLFSIYIRHYCPGEHIAQTHISKEITTSSHDLTILKQECSWMENEYQ